MLILKTGNIREFIGCRLSEGYEYDEATNFSVLAHSLLKAQGTDIEVPVEGKDYALSSYANSLCEDFFRKCDVDGANAFEVFVKTFYPIVNE